MPVVDDEDFVPEEDNGGSSEDPESDDQLVDERAEAAKEAKSEKTSSVLSASERTDQLKAKCEKTPKFDPNKQPRGVDILHAIRHPETRHTKIDQIVHQFEGILQDQSAIIKPSNIVKLAQCIYEQNDIEPIKDDEKYLGYLEVKENGDLSKIRSTIQELSVRNYQYTPLAEEFRPPTVALDENGDTACSDDVLGYGNDKPYNAQWQETGENTVGGNPMNQYMQQQMMMQMNPQYLMQMNYVAMMQRAMQMQQLQQMAAMGMLPGYQSHPQMMMQQPVMTPTTGSPTTAEMQRFAQQLQLQGQVGGITPPSVTPSLSDASHFSVPPVSTDIELPANPVIPPVPVLPTPNDDSDEKKKEESEAGELKEPGPMEDNENDATENNTKKRKTPPTQEDTNPKGKKSNNKNKETTKSQPRRSTRTRARVK